MTTTIVHTTWRTTTAKRCSYDQLRRRLHTLGVSDAQLDACHTMRDVQILAKRAWHALARHYHPDHEAQRRGWGRGTPLTGYSFRPIAEAYAWIMKQPQGFVAPWMGRPPPCPVLERDEEPCDVYGWHIAYY